MKVAVIGAGLAGLSLATTLKKEDIDVTVYEQDPHVGGRLLSQEFESSSVDLGAQYFTAREPAFISQVNEWMQAEAACLWDFHPYTFQSGRLAISKDSEQRYIGIPSNQSITKVLAEKISNLNKNHTISEVNSIDDQWQLVTPQQVIEKTFDWVCYATPPQTTLDLCAIEEINNQINPDFFPGYTLILWSSIQLNPPVQGVFVNNNPISWISQNSAKPFRALEKGSCWLVQSTPEWAEKNKHLSVEEIKKKLTAKFFDIFKITNERIITNDHLYFWNTAKAKAEPNPQGFLIDTKNKIGVCGDWLKGGRVEGAYMSGYELAQALLKL